MCSQSHLSSPQSFLNLCTEPAGASTVAWDRATPVNVSLTHISVHVNGHSFPHAARAVLSRSVVWLFAAPWTLAHQAPLAMGVLQARILQWVAMPSCRGSSKPRDGTQVSHNAGGSFTTWTTKEALPTLLPVLLLLLVTNTASDTKARPLYIYTVYKRPTSFLGPQTDWKWGARKRYSM